MECLTGWKIHSTAFLDFRLIWRMNCAPASIICGEAEVGLSKPRKANEYREILASSLEEYDRLSRMMDSLLFLAKADSAQPMINPLEVDVPTEIKKIIAFYEALAAEQNVQGNLREETGR